MNGTKTFLLLLGIGISFCACNDPAWKSDRELMMIKGNVTKMTENQYIMGNNPDSANFIATEIHSFNDDGNITRYFLTNYQIQKDMTVNYEYDGMRKLRGNISQTNPVASFSKVYEYPSDLNGYVLKNFKEDTVLSSISEFVLDEAGYTLEERAKNPKGKKKYVIFNMWENGNLVSKSVFDQDSTLIETTEISYEGNLQKSKKITDYRNNRTHEESYNHVADQNGNWTRETTIFNGKPVLIRTREFVYSN